MLPGLVLPEVLAMFMPSAIAWPSFGGFFTDAQFGTARHVQDDPAQTGGASLPACFSGGRNGKPLPSPSYGLLDFPCGVAALDREFGEKEGGFKRPVSFRVLIAARTASRYSLSLNSRSLPSPTSNTRSHRVLGTFCSSRVVPDFPSCRRADNIAQIIVRDFVD